MSHSLFVRFLSVLLSTPRKLIFSQHSLFSMLPFSSLSMTSFFPNLSSISTVTAEARGLHSGFKIALFLYQSDNTLHISFGYLFFVGANEVRREFYRYDILSVDMHFHVMITIASTLGSISSNWVFELSPWPRRPSDVFHSAGRLWQVCLQQLLFDAHY